MRNLAHVEKFHKLIIIIYEKFSGWLSLCQTVVGSGRESPPSEKKMMEIGIHPGEALVTWTVLESGKPSERVDELIWYDLVEENEL